MRPYFRAHQLIALILLLSACAQPGYKTENVNFAGRLPVEKDSGTKLNPEPSPRAIKTRISLQNKHLELIATDLVSSMVQLYELSPYSTTIQVSEPPTVFGRALVQALEYGGYGVQRVSSDQGLRYLSYGSRITQNENGQFTDYFLHVGPITINRAYKLNNGIVLPASKMTIVGSHSQINISLNDDIFLQQGDDVSFQNTVEVISPDDVSMISRRQRASGVLTQSVHAFKDQKSSLIWARDVLAGSRFDSIILSELQQYTPMFQSELTFNDSSIYMGLSNKEAIEFLYKRFDPKTDVLTLISCSKQGISTSETSQHKSRVKEEFLFLGAPIDSIVYENCPQDTNAQPLTNQVENQIIPREFFPGLVVITQYRTRDRAQLTVNTSATKLLTQ